MSQLSYILHIETSPLFLSSPHSRCYFAFIPHFFPNDLHPPTFSLSLSLAPAIPLIFDPFVARESMQSTRSSFAAWNRRESSSSALIYTCARVYASLFFFFLLLGRGMPIPAFVARKYMCVCDVYIYKGESTVAVFPFSLCAHTNGYFRES